MADPLGLAARTVAVIAPHPDDEALGCGGLIAALAADGRRVAVVFVTEGGASHPGSRRWSRERLAGLRQSEGMVAATTLGVAKEDVVFLALRDADMPAAGTPAAAAAQGRLAAFLLDLRPDLVILPWRRDPHRDHRDAWWLTRDALIQASLSPQTLEYAVWLDEIGAPEDQPAAGEAERVDFALDPAALGRKRAAIAAHQSQTTDLIDDDPTAFRLTPTTIARLSGPTETYWRPQ